MVPKGGGILSQPRAMGFLLITRLRSRSSIRRGVVTHVQHAANHVAAEAVSSVVTADIALQSTLNSSKPNLTDGHITGTRSTTVAGTVVESIRLILAQR